ncbi:uncharacterized protein LOC119111161 [Pollicipes pollicipes]|uniref:uncharacterized protein LOC119111161 n=1 Tax=Pollicipes pollicipes TaxID=41117 RepID=UPI00188553BC|nr:uncharacterized protein LOC119111161 [Pollicipes pollicipes]
MAIPAHDLDIKIYQELLVYRIRASGSQVGALGCFHLETGQLAERRETDPADPADLQPAGVTASPLTVTLRHAAGREVSVDTPPPADRRLAVTCALVTALARQRLKADAAVSETRRAEPMSARVRVRNRPPAKRPTGRSIINPSARKRTAEPGLSFESDSQE